jgi:hypothetical protein
MKTINTNALEDINTNISHCKNCNNSTIQSTGFFESMTYTK